MNRAMPPGDSGCGGADPRRPSGFTWAVSRTERLVGGTETLWRNWSLRGYSKHRGVSLRAVQKAIQTGRIKLTASGKIEPATADEEWDRNTAPRPAAARPERAAANSRPTPQSAERQLTPESSTAAGVDYPRAASNSGGIPSPSWRRSEFDERSKNLISRHEVEIAAFNRYRTYRDSMLNIADRISAVLACRSSM